MKQWLALSLQSKNVPGAILLGGWGQFVFCASSPCACVAFLWIFALPPTVQRHGDLTKFDCERIWLCASLCRHCGGFKVDGW